MIKTGNIWHSPSNVYWHLQRLTEKVGTEPIEIKHEYQQVREARMGAVLALVMFERLGRITFLQLYKPDPPDIILMQPSTEFIGQRDITQVEITSYIRQPKESLLEQLKRTKVPPGIQIYSENYILLVNVGIGLEVDYEPIRDYLNKNKTIFPVWTLQQVESHPNTIAEFVIINPRITRISINVGKAVNFFKMLGLPGVIHCKRVSRAELVKVEPAEKCYDAPWETIGR